MGGEAARRKLFLESEVVEFDFAGPDILMSKGDRESLGKDCRAKAVCMTIKAFVQAKFKEGMKKRDRELYAAWQEIMGEDEENEEPFAAGTAFEMPMKQLDWLKKFVKDDDIQISWMMAQWAEALQDYVCAIQPKPKPEPPAPEPVEAVA